MYSKSICLLAMVALSANAWINGQNYQVIACWDDADCPSNYCCAVIGNTDTPTKYARWCSTAGMINTYNNFYTDNSITPDTAWDTVVTSGY